MKHFIKQLMLFLSLPVVFILLSDAWLRHASSLYKQKINGLQQDKDSIEVLILGNSHATYGVDPKQFSLFTYNLANSGQTFYFDKRLTLSYINRLRHLRFVFISADYHSLYSTTQGERDKWLYYASGLKYKDRSYFLENISPFLFGYGPKLSFSLMRRELKKKLTKRHKKDADILMYKGYLPMIEKVSTFDQKAYKKRAKTTTNMILKSVEKNEIIEDLDEFIIFLKSRNITPILFAAPTFKDYNVFLDSHIIQQNEADIHLLCKKYRVEYWNYSADSSFKKQDFFNCDHLNTIGAVKFSNMLNDRLNHLKN